MGVSLTHESQNQITKEFSDCWHAGEIIWPQIIGLRNEVVAGRSKKRGLTEFHQFTALNQTHGPKRAASQEVQVAKRY
jgi:hypothetical protein